MFINYTVKKETKILPGHYSSILQKFPLTKRNAVQKSIQN